MLPGLLNTLFSVFNKHLKPDEPYVHIHSPNFTSIFIFRNPTKILHVCFTGISKKKSMSKTSLFPSCHSPKLLPFLYELHYCPAMTPTVNAFFPNPRFLSSFTMSDQRISAERRGSVIPRGGTHLPIVSVCPGTTMSPSSVNL